MSSRFKIDFHLFTKYDYFIVLKKPICVLDFFMASLLGESEISYSTTSLVIIADMHANKTGIFTFSYFF